MSNNAGPGQGFKYEPQEVTWLQRDLLLFANSIGATADELHLLYELHPKFAAFPTYPIILPFKGTTQEVIDFYGSKFTQAIPGVPKFDPRRVVDGQRSIEVFRPLPTSSEGKKFFINNKVVGVWDKGKASVVDTQQDLVDSNGTVYASVLSSSFYVGQGGWGGPKGPAGVNYPPPQRAPDVTFSDQTTKETALLYRLNGDYNPLHATPEPGQKMGFGGEIIHGLYSWNSTAHGLLRAVGGSDPANLKSYSARFASPVKPGDKLTTEVWKTGNKDKDGFEEVLFVTKGAGGKPVLANGRALIRTQAPSKL
ncbi:hypothetical protein Q8F55_001734 [Vanrija albida]|uniref:MaoC-like domain-containing protein n=1 Tax=Vanrija albida TaxID=181172 RepID=A0ABR3Q8F9_9TREE